MTVLGEICGLGHRITITQLGTAKDSDFLVLQRTTRVSIGKSEDDYSLAR